MKSYPEVLPLEDFRIACEFLRDFALADPLPPKLFPIESMYAIAQVTLPAFLWVSAQIAHD